MLSPQHYTVRLIADQGFCEFFSSPQIMERVYEDWFPSMLGKWGHGLLFKVIEGSSKGAYIASSTADSKLESFLLEHGVCMITAHRIPNPGLGYAPADGDACGKACLQLVK